MAVISINKTLCPKIRLQASLHELSQYHPSFVERTRSGTRKVVDVKNVCVLLNNSSPLKSEINTKSDEYEVFSLKNNSFFLEEEMKAYSKEKNAHAQALLFYHYFAAADYLTQPHFYAAIDAALSIFYEHNALAGKNVLEIGAKWGSYMHFLQNKYHANTFGIEENIRSVEYAQKEGLNFIACNPSKMPFFLKNSFDIVISRYFLDPNYMQTFNILPSIENILNEVHRILKPGGRFFSQEDEMRTILPDCDLFGSFDMINFPDHDSSDQICYSQPVNILRKISFTPSY
jgi:hypothetical protein